MFWTGTNILDIKSVSKRKLLLNNCYKTISGHFFAICIFIQDLDPLSTSKWSFEPLFCKRWRYIWRKNGQKRSYNTLLLKITKTDWKIAVTSTMYFSNQYDIKVSWGNRQKIFSISFEDTATFSYLPYKILPPY